MLFEKLNIHENIIKKLKSNNIENANEIQIQTIPLIENKNDLLVQAQTGSGKTLAYVLPIVQDICKQKDINKSKKSKIKALILVPTRELALQISKEFTQYSKILDKDFRTAVLIGGEDISKQLLYIQKSCDVVVATSGRLLDIIDKKQINLNNISYFVLDEADKLINESFKDELELILLNIPKQRQNLFFSATYPLKVSQLINKISNNTTKITINKTNIVSNINQRAISVNSQNRNALIKDILKKNKFQKVLVFMSKKRQTDNIANKFHKNGFKAQSFHGDLDQEERNFTLEEFKNGNIKILFCTDIASRGLHINGIDCVINFDLPRSVDDYIHRIGRTARAGKEGIAISFVTLENFDHFKLIEKKCKLNIQLEQIKGFELVGEYNINKKGNAPIKGKRKSKKDKLRELEKKD